MRILHCAFRFQCNKNGIWFYKSQARMEALECDSRRLEALGSILFAFNHNSLLASSPHKPDILLILNNSFGLMSDSSSVGSLTDLESIYGDFDEHNLSEDESTIYDDPGNISDLELPGGIDAATEAAFSDLEPDEYDYYYNSPYRPAARRGQETPLPSPFSLSPVMSDIDSDDDYGEDVRDHPDFVGARRRARQARQAAQELTRAAEEAALVEYNDYISHVSIHFYYPEHLDDDGDDIDAARMCGMGYLCLTRGDASCQERKVLWTWFKAKRNLSEGEHLKEVIKAGNTFIRTERRNILMNTCNEIGLYIVENHYNLFSALRGTKAYFADAEFTDDDPETKYIKHLSSTKIQLRIFRNLKRYFRPEIARLWKLPIMKALTDTVLYMQRDLFEFVVESSTTNAFNKYKKMPEEILDSFRRLDAFTILHPHDLNSVTVNNKNMLSVGLARDLSDGSDAPIAVKPRARHNPLLPVLPGQARAPVPVLAPRAARPHPRG